MLTALQNSRVCALLSLMSLAFVTSCFSPESSELNHEIVSKSKETEPIWTKQKHEALIRNSGSYDYVVKALGVTNLALGIKTTQLQAIESSRSALADQLRAEVTEGLSSSTTKSLKQNQQFNEVLNDAVKRRHADQARISDIYFEQYLDTNRSDATANQALYKIYVLVAIPAELVPQLAKDLSGRFKDSSDSSLKAVSSAIQARWLSGAGS